MTALVPIDAAASRPARLAGPAGARGPQCHPRRRRGPCASSSSRAARRCSRRTHVSPASRSPSSCTSSAPRRMPSSERSSSRPGSGAGTGPGTGAPGGCSPSPACCVAGSALWMTLVYSEKPGTGDLLFVLRLTFASAMAVCLVLGFNAARRRDIPAHRAWMVRAYAIGLAAGTQAFTEGIGGALCGSGVVRDDLAKGAGWVINLAIAEWAIGRPRRRGGQPARGSAVRHHDRAVLPGAVAADHGRGAGDPATARTARCGGCHPPMSRRGSAPRRASARPQTPKLTPALSATNVWAPTTSLSGVK